MRARAFVLVGVVAALSACAGAGPGPADSASPMDAAAEGGFPMCDDVPQLTADPALYRDTPAYVENEQPTEEVLAWAEQQPGFSSIWIDRDHNGWVAVGFTTDVAERQAEIEDLFADDGVVAVEVPYTTDELLEVQQRLIALDIEGLGGAGAMPDRGVVRADFGVLTPEVLSALAPLRGEPICVSGLPESEAVPEGEQPTGGEGWRLLGDDLTGATFRTGVATTPEQLAVLWAEAGLPGEPAEVNFETEIAVWFGAVYSSGCPVRLDAVVVTGDTLHGDFVLPGNPGACPGDANPHAFVVAVERSMLPAGPFQVQLNAEDPPLGVPEERTLVAVDLSDPGSTATDEQIGLDAALVDASDDGTIATSGDIIEVGYPSR